MQESTLSKPEAYSKSQSAEPTCSECGASEECQVAEGNEIVCESCGLVIEERQIDRGPDWRAYSFEESQNQSRTGAPLSVMKHDRGLTTTISKSDRDAQGRPIRGEKKKQLRRLRKWQRRVRASGTQERHLRFALGEIDRMASALGVPQPVRECACVVYRRAYREDLVRGRSIEAISSACLYVACRTESIPRSLPEIAGVSRIEKREIGRAYRHLSKEMGLKMRPIDPTHYISRFASELDMSQEAERKAREIAEQSIEEDLTSGKAPTGVAAAAIYLASLLCDEKQTQSDVAEVSNTTRMTLRARFKDQCEMLGLTTAGRKSKTVIE